MSKEGPDLQDLADAIREVLRLRAVRDQAERINTSGDIKATRKQREMRTDYERQIPQAWVHVQQALDLHDQHTAAWYDHPRDQVEATIDELRAICTANEIDPREYFIDTKTIREYDRIVPIPEQAKTLEPTVMRLLREKDIPLLPAADSHHRRRAGSLGCAG
jgi:hypothetical protein